MIFEDSSNASATFIIRKLVKAKVYILNSPKLLCYTIAHVPYALSLSGWCNVSFIKMLNCKIQKHEKYVSMQVNYRHPLDFIHRHRNAKTISEDSRIKIKLCECLHFITSVYIHGHTPHSSAHLITHLFTLGFAALLARCSSDKYTKNMCWVAFAYIAVRCMLVK